MDLFSEAVTGGVLLEKLFLEISQNSQENICARAPLLQDTSGRLLQIFIIFQGGKFVIFFPVNTTNFSSLINNHCIPRFHKKSKNHNKQMINYRHSFI